MPNYSNYVAIVPPLTTAKPGNGSYTMFMELSHEGRRPVLNRLKRAQGQLTGVIRMLEQDGDCEEVLTQLAAVGKALNRAGFHIVTLGLKECLAESENGEIDTKRLEKVFLSLA